LVDGTTLRQQGGIQAAVALLGRHETDRAMTVLGVVPAHEPGHPDAGLLQAAERLARILWTILQGAEQRLGVRVVITHRGSAERRRDAQLPKRRQHGGAPHWTTVIAMQYKLSGFDALTQADVAHHVAGMLTILGVVDLPTDDLATEQVQKQVQIVEALFD